MLPNLQSLDFYFAQQSELNFFIKRIEAFLEVASTKEDVIYGVELYGGHLVIPRLYHYLKQNNNKTLNLCLSLRKMNDCISWLQEQSGTFHFETFNVYIYNYPFDDTLTILFPFRGQQFARDLQKEKSGGRINTSISSYKKSDEVRRTISLLSQRPFKNIKLHFDHSKFLVKERTANGLINCIHALIDEIEEKMHPYYNITNIEEKILTLTRSKHHCAKFFFSDVRFSSNFNVGRVNSNCFVIFTLPRKCKIDPLLKLSYDACVRV